MYSLMYINSILGDIIKQWPFSQSSIVVVSYHVFIGALDNFNKLETDQVASLEVGYDYNSIMHYHPKSFSINRQDTIVAHDPNIEVGQARELSPLDIMETNLLYNPQFKLSLQPPHTLVEVCLMAN